MPIYILELGVVSGKFNDLPTAIVLNGGLLGEG